MKDSDLPDALRSMKRPSPPAVVAKAQLRLALVNAHTSSRIGFRLVLFPALFLFGVVLRYGFGWPVPGFAALEGAVSAFERLPLMSPLVLVGLPLVAFALNTLAILHVDVDRTRREMHITVKLRPLNLAIAAVALLIVMAVFAHSLADR